MSQRRVLFRIIAHTHLVFHVAETLPKVVSSFDGVFNCLCEEFNSFFGEDVCPEKFEKRSQGREEDYRDKNDKYMKDTAFVPCGRRQQINIRKLQFKAVEVRQVISGQTSK